MPASTGGGGGSSKRRKILKGYIDGQYRSGYRFGPPAKRVPSRPRKLRLRVDGAPTRSGLTRAPRSPKYAGTSRRKYRS